MKNFINKNLMWILISGYLSASTITFGYSSTPRSDDSMDDIELVTNGLGAACLWPLYWSREAFDIIKREERHD